jgi:hypothetical protein
MLEQALALAARGFHVFPCEVGGKLPVIKDFPNRATREPEQIAKWWGSADYNIGISTSRFRESQALIVVDVDNKNGKGGDASVMTLELQGNELPPTFEQRTPTGGKHLVYVTEVAAKQGVEVLGSGLDIRSRGGYIVGPGSEIAGATYTVTADTLQPAPSWLIMRLGNAPDRPAAAGEVLPGIDPDRAEQRAAEYLCNAPVSVEGQGGDLTAYKVAAKLKDFGCTQEQAIFLMHEFWNTRCSPPWSDEALSDKVKHAYQYGKEPAGSAAPEAVFPKVDTPAATGDDEPPHPVDALNASYAFIKEGAFVLQETTDEDGKFSTIRLSPPDMHAWFANKRLQVGEKSTPLSQLWMRAGSRREFDSVVFSPARDPGSRFYNLWRGFTVEPKAGDHPTLAAFLEHALNNVCNGDQALCRWLLGYFAHMIQRPWDKPLTALVFRGAKGTGKNALVERVGHLLGAHFMVADDDRYLLSNFNAHLESNLFFVLDEASWAGDKRAEGRLKGLITGAHHNIERKGAEPYKVRNLTRVAIIGNERWLVPATFDERRFAVFDVGNGRRQDRAFFESMRLGMEQGGYAHLLHFLQQFDLKGVDVNAAPKTQGLIDQVRQSMEPLHEWWLDCLESGQLVGSSLAGQLPERIPTERAYEALERWARGRNVRTRLPRRQGFIEQLREAAPSMAKKRARVDDVNVNCFVDVDLARLRSDWDRFIGVPHKWDEE